MIIEEKIYGIKWPKTSSSTDVDAFVAEEITHKTPTVIIPIAKFDRCSNDLAGFWQRLQKVIWFVDGKGFERRLCKGMPQGQPSNEDLARLYIESLKTCNNFMSCSILDLYGQGDPVTNSRFLQ